MRDPCANRLGMKPTPLLLLLSSSMITAETEVSAPIRLSSTSPRSGSTAIARTLGMCFSCAALPISSSVKGMGGSVSMAAARGDAYIRYSFLVSLSRVGAGSPVHVKVGEPARHTVRAYLHTQTRYDDGS